MNVKWIFSRMFLLCGLLVGTTQAATYSLPASSFPPCSGNWNSGSNSCSGTITLASGDVVTTSSSAITLSADGGFTLHSSVTIGSSGWVINLRSNHSDINASAGTVIYGTIQNASGKITLNGATLNGSISTQSGTVTLSATSVTGAVTSTGIMSLTGGTYSSNVQSSGLMTITGATVNGTVTVTNGGLTTTGATLRSDVQVANAVSLTNTSVAGTLTSNGSITLYGGSVTGRVSTSCCTVTATNTNLSSGVLGSSGITLNGGTIAGDLKANSNTINLTSVTMTSGSIDAGGNDIVITGGLLTANIRDANDVTIKQNATLTGDVQARYTVSLVSSTVRGSITGRSNYHLQNVDLRNSMVHGDVTVGTSWQTITGDNVSRIYGACTYKTVNPSSLCEGGGVSGAHHYRLDYSSTALTCGLLSVTIRACADAACSSTVSTPSTLTLSPSGGWGSNPITFTGNTTATLAVRSPGEITLGVGSASPAASNGLVCSTSGCKVTFLDSGFLVSVPNMISSRPQSATIAAVRKDDTSQACVPAFANVSRTLSFSTSYQNPSTGTRSITVNDSSSPATLSFNGNGVASAMVNYDDAGQVALNVSYSGSSGNSDQGLSMTGSGSFVAKPYGLCITPDTNTCSVAGVSSNCTVLAAAGYPIPIRVKAVGWQGTTANGVQTGEALNGEALCEGNTVTPNFQLSNIGLSLSLIKPDPAEGAVIGANTLPSSYTHERGEQTTLNSGGVSFSEVGVFSIAAKTNTEYMGMGHVGGDGTTPGSNASNQNQSRLIGRIVPAYLDVTPNVPLLQPSCVTNSETQAGFSYQGEAINFAVAPMLTITGKNRTNGTTTNYDRGDFWRWQSSNFIHTPEFGSDDLTIHDNSRLSGNPNFKVETNNPILGDGAQDVTISGQALTYARNLYEPLASDAAFHPYLALRFPMIDQDGVCYKSDDTSLAAPCKPYVLDNFSFPEANSQIRLGRAVLENANGSELAPLNMPLVIESWQGSYFARTSDDSCTVFPQVPVPELSDYTDNLDAGETVASTVSVGSNRFVELTEPGLGNEGSVRVTPTVPELLRYDWNGSGSFQNPSGLATFGIYQGSKPLIFRREVYR